MDFTLLGRTIVHRSAKCAARDGRYRITRATVPSNLISFTPSILNFIRAAFSTRVLGNCN